MCTLSNVLNVSIHVLEITGPLLNFPLCRFMSTGGHPGQGDEIMASPSGLVSGEQLLPLLCSTFATESTNLVSQAVLILTERSKLKIFYFWSTSSGWSAHSSKHQHTGSSPWSAPGMQKICSDKIPIKCSSVHKLWVNCNTRVSWTWRKSRWKENETERHLNPLKWDVERTAQQSPLACITQPAPVPAFCSDAAALSCTKPFRYRG